MAAIAVPGSRGRGGGFRQATAFLFLALVAMLAVMFAITIGPNLAKTKHPEAETIRRTYRQGLCEGTEVYFSPPRGTLLVLCGLPDSDLWGGLVWRITENYGHRWLGDDAYECTVFAAARHYWDGVLIRDEYLPLAMFPDIERMVRDSFGPP